MEPGDPDACSDFVLPGMASAIYNPSYDLMAGNNALQLRDKLTLHDVQICPANATSTHSHQYFIVAGSRSSNLAQLERTTLDCRRLAQNRRFHCALLSNTLERRRN